MTPNNLYTQLKTASNPYHINIESFKPNNMTQSDFQTIIQKLIISGKLHPFSEEDHGILLTYYSL